MVPEPDRETTLKNLAINRKWHLFPPVTFFISQTLPPWHSNPTLDRHLFIRESKKQNNISSSRHPLSTVKTQLRCLFVHRRGAALLPVEALFASISSSTVETSFSSQTSRRRCFSLRVGLGGATQKWGVKVEALNLSSSPLSPIPKGQNVKTYLLKSQVSTLFLFTENLKEEIFL